MGRGTVGFLLRPVVPHDAVRCLLRSDVPPCAARLVCAGARPRIPPAHHDTSSRVRSTCLAMASATRRASGLSSTGRFWWVGWMPGKVPRW